MASWIAKSSLYVWEWLLNLGTSTFAAWAASQNFGSLRVPSHDSDTLEGSDSDGVLLQMIFIHSIWAGSSQAVGQSGGRTFVRSEGRAAKQVFGPSGLINPASLTRKKSADILGTHYVSNDSISKGWCVSCTKL